jgi:hypothetical protein
MASAPKNLAPVAFEDVDSKADGHIDKDEARAYLRAATDPNVISAVYGDVKPVLKSECATCDQLKITKDAEVKIGKKSKIH